jgi:hypothetical protein
MPLDDVLGRLRARIGVLLRWQRTESDLDDEIRFHLEEEEDERMAAGSRRREARAAARRDFGNVAIVREATREIWGWGSLVRSRRRRSSPP